MLKINQSSFHKIIIADLPEFQFKESRYYDLNNPGFLAICQSKPMVFLFGRFFRNYKNLELHQETIKKYFTPIPLLVNRINDFYSETKLNTDVLIGVHVRRGDYEQFVDGKYFYSIQEYVDKMIEMQSLLQGSRVKFIICSNETIDLGLCVGISAIRGIGHLVGDMYTLAKCDFIMGPPSTYTLWASFYGKKPLYQLRDIRKKVELTDFVILPPHILYNFSFN